MYDVHAMLAIICEFCSENLLRWSDASCTDLSHTSTTTGASWPHRELVAGSLICTSPPTAGATATTVTTAVPSYQSTLTPTAYRFSVVVAVSLESNGSRTLGSGAAIVAAVGGAAAVVVARGVGVVMPSCDADGMSKPVYANVLVDNPAECRF